MLGAWANFYVIVGSSAGALTGLQFVVMTIAAEAGAVREDSVAAFGSPNVVHFCAALLVAAFLSAPWHSLNSAGAGVSVCGAVGVLYSGIVLRRAMRQRSYEPVLEDWVWHTILPTLAYATMLVGGLLVGGAPVGALFALAAAELLLLFIGIHNAWDTVMYLMVVGLRER